MLSLISTVFFHYLTFCLSLREHIGVSVPSTKVTPRPFDGPNVLRGGVSMSGSTSQEGSTQLVVFIVDYYTSDKDFTRVFADLDF